MNNKKQQHYIWKHYLSPWLKGEKVWCNRSGKIFPTSRDNIGQQRFFYEAEPLNDFERKLVISFIKKMHPTSYETSLSTLEIYDVVSRGDQLTRRNGIEEYHTSIEHKAEATIESLWDKDLSWLDNMQSKIDFSRFLGVQYCRTNRGRQSSSISLREVEAAFPMYTGLFSPDKLSKVLCLLMGDVVGNWIYSSGHFSLLSNSTTLEFITGDQPLFNLDMRGRGKNENAMEFNLFYPISPKLALLITRDRKEHKELNIDEVNSYNKFIVSCSHEQLYAKNKESLLAYLPERKVC
ncbi:DUF4238 domain-containing protein [Vibrio sp. HN007]|uniref:DUF4238 domain-containing protein n=1 Tax=Vibrio iocasae TaxID=3098914 RepID=UPI0035D4CDAF